jgi:hypothetical protein
MIHTDFARGDQQLVRQSAAHDAAQMVLILAHAPARFTSILRCCRALPW